VPSPQEIVELVQGRFGPAITAAVADGLHPCVSVTPEAWHDVALWLRDEPRLRLNVLRCLSALDGHPEPFIEIVYDLMSVQPPTGDAAGLWRTDAAIAVRVKLPRDAAHVCTVSDVWPTAEWHEREALDLMGVTFDGHPDPRRILCPDDWVGHPLRKDYVFPTEYEGIPVAGAGAKSGGSAEGQG
jgi:NADH-quinone oxidoreductase subunit C